MTTKDLYEIRFNALDLYLNSKAMKRGIINNNASYRVENKFNIPKLSKFEVESIINHHPAHFNQIYLPRQVNNIYFDSNNYSNYYDNINGLAKRLKVRIRWYGPTFGIIQNPILELKIKNGLLGKKLSFNLPSFLLNNNFSSKNIMDVISESELPEIIKHKVKLLNPVLFNCYFRKYFQSANKDYRITFDTNLFFYQIKSYNNKIINKIFDNCIVLELKYGSCLTESHTITNHFPFRVTKFSKYIHGIEKLFII